MCLVTLIMIFNPAETSNVLVRFLLHSIKLNFTRQAIVYHFQTSRTLDFNCETNNPNIKKLREDMKLQ